MNKFVFVSSLCLLASVAQAGTTIETGTFKNNCLVTSPGSNYANFSCKTDNPEKGYGIVVQTRDGYSWVKYNCYSLEDAVTEINKIEVCNQDPKVVPQIKTLYSGD